MNYDDIRVKNLTCYKNNLGIVNTSKNNIIIKRKKQDLDFNINLNKRNKKLRIQITNEYMYINNKKIRIIDIKTIYIGIGGLDKHDMYPALKIISKGMCKVSVLIDKVSEEDYRKIVQLFDYFIFSNETKLDRITSIEFIPILNGKNTVKYILKKYPIQERKENAENCMVINGVKYSKMAILPKKFYKKYLKNKYILYESIMQNDNYMDVWVDSEKYEKDIKLRFTIERILYVILFVGIIALTIACSFIE